MARGKPLDQSVPDEIISFASLNLSEFVVEMDSFSVPNLNDDLIARPAAQAGGRWHA